MITQVGSLGPQSILCATILLPRSGGSGPRPSFWWNWVSMMSTLLIPGWQKTPNGIFYNIREICDIIMKDGPVSRDLNFRPRAFWLFRRRSSRMLIGDSRCSSYGNVDCEEEFIKIKSCFSRTLFGICPFGLLVVCLNVSSNFRNHKLPISINKLLDNWGSDPILSIDAEMGVKMKLGN